MTSKDVVAKLQRRLRGYTQVGLAGDLGVSPQYLSDVLREKRLPGDKILEPLGLRAVTVYLPR